MAERVSLRSIAFVACTLICVTSTPTRAHDMWADGSPIPAWVSNKCCGAADAHRLTFKQIHRIEDGWRVDGYAHIVPNDSVLPSEDGYVWLFYASYEDGDPVDSVLLLYPARK